jgi:NAD(P)H-dependent FMN reductase
MSQVVRPALLLLGSHRQNGNAAGLASWVTSVWESRRTARGAQVPLEPTRDIVAALPSEFEGPLTESTIPAAITSSEGYANPSTRAWSERVRDSSALVVLTPQYNWSFPGTVKNALDHLYFEWNAKPILLVTYGGHGGSKAAEHLRGVFENALKAKVVDEVRVTLPGDYIRSPDTRVPVDSPPEFLKAFEDDLKKAIDAVLDTAEAAEAATKTQA